MVMEVFGKSRRYIVRRAHPGTFPSLMKVQHAKMASQISGGILQNRLKTPAQFTGRTADDLENLGCRRLLFQRVAQFIERRAFSNGYLGLIGVGPLRPQAASPPAVQLGCARALSAPNRRLASHQRHEGGRPITGRPGSSSSPASFLLRILDIGMSSNLRSRIATLCMYSRREWEGKNAWPPQFGADGIAFGDRCRFDHAVSPTSAMPNGCSRKEPHAALHDGVGIPAERHLRTC